MPEKRGRNRIARHSPGRDIVAIDGVYAAGSDGCPEFHELSAPEDADVIHLTTLVARRIQLLIERRGLGAQADPAEADALSRDDPGLATLYASSVRGRVATGPNTGNRVVTLGDQIDGDSLDALQSSRCATVSGFSVHAHERLRMQAR